MSRRGIKGQLSLSRHCVGHNRGDGDDGPVPHSSGRRPNHRAIAGLVAGLRELHAGGILQEPVPAAAQFFAQEVCRFSFSDGIVRYWGPFTE